MTRDPLCVRFYPGGDDGEVREFLQGLRGDPARFKGGMRVEQDIYVLAKDWPLAKSVDIRLLRGWEPLRELRRTYDGIGYRVFFRVLGRELWLLSAFEKRSETTPRRELEKAYRRMLTLEDEP